MLNPEVVKFPAPKSQVSYSQHIWDDVHNDHSWHKVVDDHPFNTKVSLLLPDTPNLPQLISDAVTQDTQFYLVKNLPLLELCTSTFLQAFVKTVVEVNMKVPYFKPGKAFYSKVMTAFTEVQLRFNFWLTWIPDDTDICPSSVAKYFYDLGYSIEELHSSLSQSIMTEAVMPSLCKDGEAAAPEDVLEWLGCQTLGVKLEAEGTRVCEIVTPKPNILVNNLCTLHCTGFFTPVQLQFLLRQLRMWLNQKSISAVPWISMTVYGHPDSPITWGNQEHVYCTNGDNFYTLVILRDKLRIYKISGSRKPQRLYVKSNKNK
ncbi:ribonuclease P protein subunit p40 isoform X2 [Cherax quadricarinatus]|uniref:ribonuclease P protein subunit p40 isoform X2 n=1 Tax=Cherax quadricarinatus TaxID=27406 RepID=UPI0023794A09|nr:ribonuclease P protein subunit p40-like isoform X2 [Cherax quadricarinatus]